MRRAGVAWLVGLVLAVGLAHARAETVAGADPGASALAGDRADALATRMRQALQDEAITGAVWAVVEPDGDGFGAAGLADASTRAPMTPAHRVQVGSVAKVVVAIGILRLVQDGRLTLDTPLAAVLPQVPLDNRWDATDPVRIRHLLAHTAGLEHSRFRQVFSLRPRADTPLLEAVAGDPSLRRVQVRPGSRYAYSNIGYALLGLVIEQVTGGPYEAYLDAQVLAPLGLHESTFRFVTQAGPDADPRLAMGHFENGATQPAIPTTLRSAGQFTTTAADMARLARFLMGDGTVGGEPFLAAAHLVAFAAPAGTEAADAGLGAGHGLALATRDRHGVLGGCHPGTTYGFVAMLCVFPEQKKAFFVGTNADSETADYDRLNRVLMDALALAQRPARPVAVPAPDVGDWNGFYVPVPKTMLRLAWIDDTLNVVRVRWDGQRLRVEPLQADERVLAPVGGRLFRAPDRRAASHVLLTTPDGVRVLSDGLHSWERVSTTGVVLRWLSLGAGLLGLAWVLVAGGVRALAGRLPRTHPLFVPLLGVLALALPVPLFAAQSFLQLGDRTPASIALAIATVVAPLALLVGLVQHVRRRDGGLVRHLDAAALAAALQWFVVLAFAGMLPFRLWL